MAALKENRLSKRVASEFCRITLTENVELIFFQIFLKERAFVLVSE